MNDESFFESKAKLPCCFSVLSNGVIKYVITLTSTIVQQKYMYGEYAWDFQNNNRIENNPRWVSYVNGISELWSK